MNARQVIHSLTVNPRGRVPQTPHSGPAGARGSQLQGSRMPGIIGNDGDGVAQPK